MKVANPQPPAASGEEDNIASDWGGTEEVAPSDGACKPKKKACKPKRKRKAKCKGVSKKARRKPSTKGMKDILKSGEVCGQPLNKVIAKLDKEICDLKNKRKMYKFLYQRRKKQLKKSCKKQAKRDGEKKSDCSKKS